MTKSLADDSEFVKFDVNESIPPLEIHRVKQLTINSLSGWAIPLGLNMRKSQEFSFYPNLPEMTEFWIRQRISDIESAPLQDALSRALAMLDAVSELDRIGKSNLAWFILVKIEGFVKRIEQLGELATKRTKHRLEITPVIQSKLVQLIFDEAPPEGWKSFRGMCKAIVDRINDFYTEHDFSGSAHRQYDVSGLSSWKNEPVIAAAFEVNSANYKSKNPQPKLLQSKNCED